ncbi:MAG: DUF4062 domain-containing protein [Planctomycetaceae bacterium]|jgi:hypothetical protein|nr:DUF4062 domain-containing protein [Planctomycetaceae bacterium]
MSNQLPNIADGLGFSARVYRVFIASPSDVKAEREHIQNVLSRWNTLHSQQAKKIFLPVCWENNSYPESGIHPQAAINKQVLKDADILIGVFWSRLGTATENYPSGTIEEYEEHIKSKKPAMLYFSKANVPQENFDSEQYNSLQQFKESCKTKSLYKEYENADKFSDLLSDDLTNMINKDSHFTTKKPRSTTKKIRIVKKKYYYNNLPLKWTVLHSSPEIQLDDIAKEMLIKTAEMNTVIIHSSMPNGVQIGPNKDYRHFAWEQKKEIAKYEAVIESLKTNGLIKDRENKGQIFDITDKGYKWIDRNKQTSNPSDNI